jgi:hypothetical protein
MVRRHVEQLEVGEVVLDLAAAVHLKAEVGKDGVDLAHDLRGDVQPAAADGAARQRDIDDVFGEAAFQGGLALIAPGPIRRLRATPP